MPKRKRDDHGAGGRDPKHSTEKRRQDVEQKIAQGVKSLHRTLKTASRFEWQKLGKRIKLATENAEKGRLQRELNALNGLDISILATNHIHKTLLKAKTIAESEFLPESVKAEIKKPAGSAEEVLAIGNVTARLYNAKVVKETMSQITSSVYLELGITPGAKSKPSQTTKPQKKEQSSREEESPEPIYKARKVARRSSIDMDIDELEFDERNSPEASEASDLDSEDISRYEGLLGNSSDSDSEDADSESEVEIKRPKAKRTIKSRGISVSISGCSRSPSPEPSPKEKKAPRAPPPATKSGSQFLPTLMGGYWSGSESSATENEDVAPAPRKNRPGQQARRAIWEKKYGAGAKHLKGQAKAAVANAKTRDKDWDAKRGAKASDEKPAGRGRGGRPGFARSREQVTGENAIEVAPRKGRGLGKKDDTGVIHPSWEAAKFAKEKKLLVPFQGKKVVFD